MAVLRRVRATGADPLKIIDGLIVPAQERVGELWLEGEWSIAQEHAATAVNEGLVHWLCSDADPPAPDAPLVVVSCLERERHAFPALVVSEALGLAGYRVNYLGSDPEPGDLLRRVLALKPRAVLFSASLTSSLGGQKSLFGSIRAIGIPVIVGGRAFGGDERRATALGATAYAGTIDDVLRLLTELPERREPGQSLALGPADEEAAWVREYAGEIAPYVLRAIAHHHENAPEPPPWWTDLESHMDHVVGCLAAALVTGDETIMVEVRDWLTQVLARRGADPELVDEIWELLAEPLRGHPLARLHLAGSSVPVSADVTVV
jgi:methanogenic corrinoid protein MtbC1